MKKNIYLVIIWVITIMAIILGTLFHMTDWGVEVADNVGIKRYETQKLDDTLQAFDKISFEIDLAEIRIETGEKYHIFCESTRNVIPEYELDGTTLHITQTSKNRFFPKRNGHDNCIIVITVPSDATISDITGDCAMGDFRMDGFAADTISVTCNMGEAILTNVTAKDITCECNMGSCEIKDCSFDNLMVDNDMGNVEVTSSQSLSDYTMELSVSMGSIEVDGKDYTSHYEQDGEKDKTITITNNMGSVEVEGE
ncbi:MAG: DUF4097 family beta strand repeat protein [Lachnospira sp.]|nr:DUF4097 family beta strand repeat protein [Lachnospira sp.]